MLSWTWNGSTTDGFSLKKLPERSPAAFKKVCAKFLSGIKFGLGFALERTYGSNCDTCTGTPFHRKCRFFNFKPHHLVSLEKKLGNPELNVCPYLILASVFLNTSLGLRGFFLWISVKFYPSFHILDCLYTEIKAWNGSLIEQFTSNSKVFRLLLVMVVSFWWCIVGARQAWLILSSASNIAQAWSPSGYFEISSDCPKIVRHAWLRWWLERQWVIIDLVGGMF